MSVPQPSFQFVNITIPVYNEEVQLASNVTKVAHVLENHLNCTYEIVIADNASTDGTLGIALELANQNSRIRVLHVKEKGRGRAVKQAWLDSRAEVLVYMDVDLSTDIFALPSLLEPLHSGEFDIAIGSRLLRPDWTNRGWKRQFISRSYNFLVKMIFHTHFSDAQCGFKAITPQAAKQLLPLVEDVRWFFDTELLVLAEKLGYRIFDLPVHWVDDPDSRVKIFGTAIEDIKGMVRLRRNLWKARPAEP